MSTATLTPAAISETPLSALRVNELFLFTETVMMAWEANPAGCAADTYLAEQVSALYFPCHYVSMVGLEAGLSDADLRTMAARLEAMKTMLDAIDVMSMAAFLAA
jgi:hypothetical protein